MTRTLRSGFYLLVTVACLCGGGCQLKRPQTMPIRMIEPQLLEPPPPDPAVVVFS